MIRANQKGFTVIELMIVVAIIGILAALALPKFAALIQKSRTGCETACVLTWDGHAPVTYAGSHTRLLLSKSECGLNFTAADGTHYDCLKGVEVREISVPSVSGEPGKRGIVIKKY
jgi:prepilin-type N-terminal cleavage/methylation domain-containing protein